jgi:hypothetical protein
MPNIQNDPWILCPTDRFACLSDLDAYVIKNGNPREGVAFSRDN